MSSEYQRVKIQPLKLISTGSVEMRNMHAVAFPKRGTKSANRVRYWKRRAVWWAAISRLECCVVVDAVANFVLVSWYCWLMKTNSWGMTMSNIDDHESHRSRCGLGLKFIVSSEIMIVVIWGWCRTGCPIFPDPRSSKRRYPTRCGAGCWTVTLRSENQRFRRHCMIKNMLSLQINVL